MNQLGPVFRDSRVQSGKTIDDAVRETKIAKKYLIAIENEDFDIFPGETYIIGFLRNYAQFLGLDPDEMIIKYRDYKIQEQPAPIEQLTARPKNTRRNFLMVFVILVVIGAAIYIIFGGRDKEQAGKIEKEAKEEEAAVAPEEEQRLIVFEEEEITRDFEKGDLIQMPHKGKDYVISIDGVNEDLGFSIGAIPFSLASDERVEVDFDRDGRKDLLIRTNVIGEGRVNLTMKRLYKTGTGDSEISLEQEETGTGVGGGPPEVAIIKEGGLLSKELIAPKTGFQIVSGYEKAEISTMLRARATVYCGYLTDSEEKKENLLKSGDELPITAKEVLRIMVTNANGVDVEINSIPVALGEGGQVVAKIVRWYRDAEDSDLYHLIIDDWEK
jgi:cytoskeleton protein RodZ